MDRRSSDDDRRPRERPNPNVFDDEYALDPADDDFMPTVSDGFRPANASQGGTGERHNHERDEPPRPSFSHTKSDDSIDLRRMASRNSTMKTPFARESTAQDGRQPGTHNRLPSSQAAALQHRASISSTGSFATMARSESPFGVGPSHPYGMYPQNTMARTSSVTTASTQRQPHRSVSLQRPTHPYGMYTQNVDETADEPAAPAVPTAIPVGFPGLNTGFHRQIGPDGEEQDIIGPDGHTEQLPPYSRYPEEGPTKAALAAEASASPVATTPPLLPLPPPVSASNDALIAPPSRPVTQQQELPTREVPLTTTTTTSDSSISEKNEVAAAPSSWRKKRLWGRVPMGVAVCLLVLVLVFAIILGAAIGTFVTKKRDNNHGSNKGNNNKGDNGDPQPQISLGPTLFDASPIPTPTPGLTIPTGPFALPLGIPQEANPGCLTQANQFSAWSCKMSFAPLTLIINDTTSGSPNPVASIQPAMKPDGTVPYGIQPPLLIDEPLQLVTDLDYPRYGPAFHFQTTYDKLVVLNSEEFQGGTSKRKRDDGDKPNFRQRFQVLPGDTPWFCHWNETFIEGYIYVSNNSSAATRTGSASWPTSDPYASGIPSSLPTDLGAATTDLGGSPTIASGSEGTPTATPFARRGDGDYPRPPAYPRIVKIEERRLQGAPQPYCQQMQLLDNNHFVEARDANGGPIIVKLQEQDPTLEQFLLSGGPPPPASSTSPSNNTRRELGKRTDPAGACHCQWMFM
ncbi:hypothetical protein BDV96DRAFT_492711 [Lophiotrema nucula]|uniref:DUF7820 domain-containing protein n=1 Tax=Lophiotrema nucula TaxID=690887 RepID=A0A6A5Z911_9PLEO|nr:hypothetical protein BDV96DRAFT_492711 [Lophiotrema nucula]